MCQDMLQCIPLCDGHRHVTLVTHTNLPRFSENSILFRICESSKISFRTPFCRNEHYIPFLSADCVGQFEKQACFFSIDFFSLFLGPFYPLPLRIQCILNQPLHPLHFGDFGMDRYTLLPNRSKRYTNFEHKHLSLFGWCACFVMPRRLVAFIRGVTVHEVGINRKCFTGGSSSCISTVAGSSYLT